MISSQVTWMSQLSKQRYIYDTFHIVDHETFFASNESMKYAPE